MLIRKLYTKCSNEYLEKSFRFLQNSKSPVCSILSCLLRGKFLLLPILILSFSSSYVEALTIGYGNYKFQKKLQEDFVPYKPSLEGEYSSLGLNRVEYNQCYLLKPRMSESRKYNFSICATFNAEFSHLKEWLEYHRLIGVDHFYLYNTGGSRRFLEILNPYIKEGLVTLIQWFEFDFSDGLSFKGEAISRIFAYENAVHVSSNSR